MALVEVDRVAKHRSAAEDPQLERVPVRDRDVVAVAAEVVASQLPIHFHTRALRRSDDLHSPLGLGGHELQIPARVSEVVLERGRVGIPVDEHEPVQHP